MFEKRDASEWALDAGESWLSDGFWCMVDSISASERAINSV